MSFQAPAARATLWPEVRVSLLLMIAMAAGPAWAQEPESNSEEVPRSETDSDTATETETETETEAPEAPAPAVETEPAEEEPQTEPAQEELATEPAQEGAQTEPAKEELYKSYQDGFLDGQMSASEAAGQYGLHGLAGLGAGCLAGPCGCIVPAADVLINPAVPNGVWRAQNSEYQQGYIEGYQRSIQRKRVIYSAAGVGVGTVLGVGAGLAYGALLL